MHRDGLEQAGEPSAHSANSAGKRQSAGTRTGERAECVRECGAYKERRRVQRCEGIGKRLETAKIAFSGLRERAGVSVGRASQQTQSHSLSACCFFKYDLLFFRQEEYSVFHFGPRTLLSARKRGVWQCFCHVVHG